MSEHNLTRFDSVLGHEGPTLINFLLDLPQFELGVNGPKLLFTGLEVRTSLHLQDGCDYAALRKLADGFKVTAYCGHSPSEEVATRVVGSNLAPYLSIDVGPPSMYMSHLVFETNTNETFADLCDRILNPLGRSDYLVALAPVLNEEIGHSRHDSHAHGDGFTPLSAAREEMPRHRYRIEYVLRR